MLVLTFGRSVHAFTLDREAGEFVLTHPDLRIPEKTGEFASSASAPRGIDFQYLLAILHGSSMSRQNSIVAPGGNMDLAMQIVFTPMILQLIDRRRRAT